MVPRAIQLAVGPHGGHQHPVEREQQAEDEQAHRQVEPQPLLPARAFDHHRFSTRRMYQSWNTTTSSKAGNIASEIAPPSDSSPVPTPIWYAYVAKRCVPFARPPPVSPYTNWKS